MPQFVKDEFDTYLKCGILAHGFLRLRCADCAHEKLVAFSCKRRGFCPSCGARRMAETAAHLVERIIPRVPVRQWFLSFPNALRALLAAHPQRVSEDLQIVHRVFATFLIKQAGLKRTDAHTGAVTLIQRFGSAANLNLHHERTRRITLALTRRAMKMSPETGELGLNGSLPPAPDRRRAAHLPADLLDS